MIEPNSPTKIEAVSNGFIVTAAYGPNLAVSINQTLVFESKPSLLQWLAEHFYFPTPASKEPKS